MDLDPFAPAIAHDLLHSNTKEWRGVADIVKLTMIALCDVMRCQGSALRELEHLMPTKCSKQELNVGLASKANLEDFVKTENHFASTSIQHDLS